MRPLGIEIANIQVCTAIVLNRLDRNLCRLHSVFVRAIADFCRKASYNIIALFCFYQNTSRTLELIIPKRAVAYKYHSAAVLSKAFNRLVCLVLDIIGIHYQRVIIRQSLQCLLIHKSAAQAIVQKLLVNAEHILLI